MSAQEPQGGPPMTPEAQAILAEVQRLQEAVAATGPPVIQEDLSGVLDDLLRAVRRCASDAASAGDTRENRELGQSALAFAQAWVIMHPSTVSPSGLPVDQHLALEVAKQAAVGQPGGTTGRPPQPTARRTGEVKG